MKLATLKKLERAAYALMVAVDKERKSDAQAERLWQQYGTLWQERRNQFHEAEVAAALKRDKGVELFTVYVPDKNCIREVRRTPNCLTTQYHWRRGYPITTHFERSQMLTEVLPRNIYTPEYHWRLNMKCEVVV